MDALARAYYDDYQTVRLAAARAQRKRADLFLAVGAVLVAASVFLSCMTYLMSDNEEGLFVGFYGLLGLGLFALLKGTVDKHRAKTELQRVP
ncbi:hypothetical protein [Hymenobacter terrenus]|uniref:hypothetical protein n=1 Tax=Hymenobacter terrenus TaxID=1629124 RepID=UPI0012E08258|nr:hypothetical protein [Hymenobacter terrenus]